MKLVKDDRPRVQLWSRKSFTRISESRVLGDDRPIDTIAALLRESGQPDAVATVDWNDGSRWSGFIYLDKGGRVNVLHHDELHDLADWPEFDNRGPKGEV